MAGTPVRATYQNHLWYVEHQKHNVKVRTYNTIRGETIWYLYSEAYENECMIEDIFVIVRTKSLLLAYRHDTKPIVIVVLLSTKKIYFLFGHLSLGLTMFTQNE